MAKILRDGAEYFDGEQVDLYEGRFTGNFFVEPASGAAMSNDDLVTFIVTARVSTPKFSHVKKTGDLKRSNSMRIEKVVPIDSEKAAWMYDQINVKVDGVNEGAIIETPVEPVERMEPTVVQDTFFVKQEVLSS
jgi:hypothetical protein